jgi:integrase
VLNSYGVMVLRLHGRNGSVKTVARDVPIHSACLADIRKQVAAVKKRADSPLAPDGERWLFPETVCLRANSARGHDYQLAAGRFLRGRLAIADPRLTMHSLRHTFRDLCREAEMLHGCTVWAARTSALFSTAWRRFGHPWRQPNDDNGADCRSPQNFDLGVKFGAISHS